MQSISYFKNINAVYIFYINYIRVYKKLLLFVFDLELQREVHFSHLIPFDCELCMRAASGLLQFMQASGPPSLTRPMAQSRSQRPTVDPNNSSSSSTLDQSPVLFPPQSSFEHLLAKSGHLHHLTSINPIPPLLNIENSTETMAENRETSIRHDAGSSSLCDKGGLLLDFEKYPVFHLKTYSL